MCYQNWEEVNKLDWALASGASILVDMSMALSMDRAARKQFQASKILQKSILNQSWPRLRA